MSAFSPSVVCASCDKRVAYLCDVACIHDKIGCHLVAALARLNGDTIVSQRPHSDCARFPFKRGKLYCSCGKNMGNIQNNMRATVPEAGLHGQAGEVAVLKFANLQFRLSTGELIRVPTGSALGSAVGFGGGGGHGATTNVRKATNNAISLTTTHILLAAGGRGGKGSAHTSSGSFGGHYTRQEQEDVLTSGIDNLNPNSSGLGPLERNLTPAVNWQTQSLIGGGKGSGRGSKGTYIEQFSATAIRTGSVESGSGSGR